MPHGIVLDEARQVAKDLRLPPWWLNEQATAYISGKDDPGKRRVFDHPGLRVMAASPEHVFAMKALAARTRDIDDLRLLAGMIGIETAELHCRYARTSILTSRYPREQTQSCGSFSVTPASWAGVISPPLPRSDRSEHKFDRRPRDHGL
jgi:hypothetical protein